jgi:hypothetical protein
MAKESVTEKPAGSREFIARTIVLFSIGGVVF